MSDQSPPPKPKPGSLRDRIAAFEKSSASAAPTPPPPRPKPGGVSWKPKPPSPPSSPKAIPDGEKKASGMSASDAKESIGKGVSLKERMAALQGKGGFGAPAPPTAPKPAAERPKWKPPPVVSPPADEGSDPIVSEPAATADAAIEAQKSPPIVSEDASTPPAPPADEDEKDQEAVDPEEEERQRRAAIAARIARLGGARVGMGPPIFGRPAVPAKKPTLPHEEPAEQNEVKDEEVAAKTSSDEPVQEHAIVASDEPHPVSEERDSNEGLQPPEEVSPPPQARSPNSMPVPAAPRRAAPPRRKAAKSPAPPPEEVSPIPSTTEEETPAAISDDVTPAPAPVPEETSTGSEEPEPTPRTPPVDAHIESVTAGTGPLVDPSKAILATDDKEDDTPALADTSKATPSIADKDSDETLFHADTSKATPANVEVEPEEIPSPAPALEESSGLNPSTEPSISTAKELSQNEVKAESPLQPPSHELLVEEEEKDEGQTVDVNVPSPVSQKASVGPSDDIPLPAVDLPTPTPAAPDVGTSPPAVFHGEESSDSVVEPTEEEEEAARRARVAARLAKMGAVNPFAPPPQRRLSHEVVSPPPTSGASKTVDESAAEPSPAPRPPPVIDERDEEINTQKEVSPEHSEPASPALDISKTQKGTEDDVPSNVTEDAKYPIDTPLRSLSDKREASIESIPKPIIDAAGREDISDSTDPHLSTESTPLPDVVSPRPQASYHVEETAHPPHPPHPRRSLPPPRRVAPQSPDDVHDDAGVVASPADLAVPPSLPGSVEEPKRPTRLPPRPISDNEEEEEEEEEEAHPSHRLGGVQHESYHPPDSPPSEIDQPSTRLEIDDSQSRRSIPPLQTPQMQLAPDEPQTPSQASQPDEEALPTVLRFHPSSQDGDDEESLPESPGSPIEGLHYEEVEVISPVPPPRSYQAAHAPSELPPLGVTSPNREILDEEEGDPIDPSFHSPVSPQSSRPNLRAENKASEVEPSADDDQVRRQTIAERMAKLGGIKLGGAPPLMRRPPPTPKATPDVPEEEEGSTPVEPLHGDEEDEQARRQRILARLAGSGGMRLGMIPSSVPSSVPHHPTTTRVTRAETEEEPAIPAPPPRRAAPDTDIESAPPPPPHRVPHPVRSLPVQPPVETDSEPDSQTFSDAVQVEAEESELEEVKHEDADIPPPIPVRIGRHLSVESTSTMREQPNRKASLPPAPPTGRPPVPKVNLAMRRTSTDYSHQTHQAAVSQSDYVLVSDSMSDPEEVAPPPPPRYTAKHPVPPSRGVPHPPPPPPPPDLDSSQWELPSVPTASIDFGEKEPDLSLSNWSEDSATFATSPPPTSAAAHSEFVPVVGHQHLADDHPRSSEELMMVWGRVGVQICEVATMLFEKSKKTLIGDGSYPGFIHAVLAEVPNAASPKGPLDFGSLIYMQTANAVQKRLAEIMPGDILLLDDVKLKGHKGLQIYHQNVGTDEPLIAVINDFEAKKSKVKVFQANQHVGQQTVESASYRLEDVKSGVVKVFRVLEA